MIFKKHCILFYLTNSVDPDEMQSRECSIMVHFILVFTVCKSFHRGGGGGVQNTKG